VHRAALQTRTWDCGNVRMEYLTNPDRNVREPIIRIPHPSSRLAAVLVLLYERAGRIHVLLTTRSKELRSHPGQTALPGGKVDKEDGDVIETAVSPPSVPVCPSVLTWPLPSSVQGGE
jgi:hypothetical protein